MAEPPQYSLKWRNYLHRLTFALDSHRDNNEFVDVSLLCDGRKINAHKVVLSSCSDYFKEIFIDNPHPHPLIVFKFVKYEDLNSIIKFMYQGEVNVQQEGLHSFFQTAKMLQVHGLDMPGKTLEDYDQTIFKSTASSKGSISVSSQNWDASMSDSMLAKSNNCLPSAFTTTKLSQPVASCSNDGNSAKKRKITNTDYQDDSASVAECLVEQTLLEPISRNARDSLRMDVLGDVENQLTQSVGSKDNNQNTENIIPDITNIKSEYDMSENEDEFTTLDTTEMTIEKQQLFDPSSSFNLTPQDETASCSNIGISGNKGSSSEDFTAKEPNTSHHSNQYIPNSNTGPLQQHSIITENTPILSQILAEIKSLTEEVKSHNVLVTRLTEETKTLRGEVSQLEKQNSVMIMDDDASLKALPISCIEEALEFDKELQQNHDTRKSLVRMMIKRVGGTDLSQFTKNCFKLLVTDELAMKFSWTGTKDKPRIKDYFFVSIIRCICHRKFQNIDDTKINSILQKHIVHAKDRVDKRLKSAKSIKT